MANAFEHHSQRFALFRWNELRGLLCPGVSASSYCFCLFSMAVKWDFGLWIVKRLDLSSIEKCEKWQHQNLTTND